MAGGRYQMAGGRYQMAGGRYQMAGGRYQMAGGRRSGYLIYPYVDLSAPGPDGDQYVLHTCHGR
jgi:hypothetical protein